MIKPHGHGDVHLLLHQSGLLNKLRLDGIEYISIIQDTNGLSFHALPAALGVSIKHQLLMNSLAVPRNCGDAVGAICALKHKHTLKQLLVNIEYNQLALLTHNNEPCIKDALGNDTNKSIYPGNINVLIFQVDKYLQVLARTNGLVPEFINPKYMANTKQFKKPTRLETMMQIYLNV